MLMLRETGVNSVTEAQARGFSRREAAGLLAGVSILAAASPRPAKTETLASEKLSSFSADEAVQAVAVDQEYAYAIANSRIGKYRKDTGARVREWNSDPKGPIRHLNSGIILDGVLYCCNSNYPETPMASSIEMFDPQTLEHLKSHSFGIDIGSATWLERKEDNWYVTFAHYDGRGGTPGKDYRHTQMVRFDSSWRRTGGWVFPPNVLESFAPQSNSGGVFGEDGLIYATAHHNEELYVLKFPKMGPVLESVNVIASTTEGQGIAWDPVEPRILWGISRARREVLSWRIPEVS